MLRWLCIIVNLVDFVVWMVRIVTCVLRRVHIRKVYCIFKDSQLMELRIRIKGKLETRIKVELGTRCKLGTHIESGPSFIIIWTRIKVELETRIKVQLRTHIESNVNFHILRDFYYALYLFNMHHAQAPILTHASNLHSLNDKNSQNSWFYMSTRKLALLNSKKTRTKE